MACARCPTRIALEAQGPCVASSAEMAMGGRWHHLSMLYTLASFSICH